MYLDLDLDFKILRNRNNTMQKFWMVCLLYTSDAADE